MKRFLVMVVLALAVGSAALAAADPAAAVDVGSVATSALTNLSGMVTDALPYIAGAIGLGIVLRWAKRVFKF